MTTSRIWRCRDRELRVYDRVHVMGVLNVTPDSFSDGGVFLDRDAAIKRGVQMADDGADIIDIGGESSRPGAEPVPAVEELERVVPVVKALVNEVDAAISIDTTKAEVAEAALDNGAVIVNDISAMRFDPTIGETVASSGAGLILMHMLGEPRTMQKDPRYDDVVSEVSTFLRERVEAAEASGIDKDRIAIDPGIGFGKTLEHNLELIKNLEEFRNLGYPVVVGPSRKTFIGLTLGLSLQDSRSGLAPLEGTAAVVAWLAANGANLVRVHDVKEMVKVVRMIGSITGARVSDRIRINRLRVFGHHGVDPAERVRGQDFLVDIEIEMDLDVAGRSDRLEDTVDYSPLIKEVQRIVSQDRYELIEALAERIAEAVLESPNVSSTTVRVAKPDPPIDADLESVEVEITRSR